MTKVRVHDELWYNNETGEIVTATQAIRDFYRDHDWSQSWTDYYTFTGQHSAETLGAPDFAKTVNGIKGGNKNGCL